MDTYMAQSPFNVEFDRGVRWALALYTLCLHPFLLDLERRLPGVCIDRNSKPISVVAYAEDVTIILTTASDISTLEEAIRQFEEIRTNHEP
jgi:hypothetical protein